MSHIIYYLDICQYVILVNNKYTCTCSLKVYVCAKDKWLYYAFVWIVQTIYPIHLSHRLIHPKIHITSLLPIICIYIYIYIFI